MKILFCYGTRPESIKVTSLIHKLEDDGEIGVELFTLRQQKDLICSGKEITNYGNRLDDIVRACLEQFPETNADYVLVQGDTTTAFGCALAAFHRGKKIIHLEAGMRSYNNKSPYPEEFNRAAISRMADIHFCTTAENKGNLIRENIQGDFYMVGSTGLDDLEEYRDSTKEGNLVVCTLHRRENLHKLRYWFDELGKLSVKYKNFIFLLPRHPNPYIVELANDLSLTREIEVINPLTRHKFIDSLTRAKIVITDSGGVQEESIFLGKNVIVCREFLERNDPWKIQCPEPYFLGQAFEYALTAFTPKSDYYGDGKATEKITNELYNRYNL